MQRVDGMFWNWLWAFLGWWAWISWGEELVRCDEGELDLTLVQRRELEEEEVVVIPNVWGLMMGIPI